MKTIFLFKLAFIINIKARLLDGLFLCLAASPEVKDISSFGCIFCGQAT